MAAKVTQLTNYGAWVEWPGHHALVLIYDFPKKLGDPIRHPSEIVKVGQEVQVTITKHDALHTRARMLVVSE